MFKFSLKKGETAEQSFWNRSNQNPYSVTMLQAIEDSNSEEAVSAVTSIPSPFARMQLFKTAFELVEHNQKLEGNSIYHQIISDCLDVYELLFRIDELHFRKDISLSVWRPEDMEEMQGDLATEGQRNFANTIKLFIERYNENERSNDPFNMFFILSYNGIPIAGTSPYTGFFTTPNPIDAKISFRESRTFFDPENPVPLHRRDPDFRKFLFLFFRKNRLSNVFKPVHDYLIKSNELNASNDLKDYFRNINSHLSDMKQYAPLQFENNELLIYPGIVYQHLTVKKEDFITLVQNSDYLLRTTKQLEQTPLILKEGMQKDRWIYLRDKLPANFKLPPNIAADYNNRILPETSERYPFLVEQDLLEEYLVELNYPINSTHFFTGAIDESNTPGYLLPIKADWFRFFTLNDLKNCLKVEFFDKNGGHEYEVTLTIPVNGDQGNGNIVFSKRYITYDNIANKSPEDGAIIPLQSGHNAIYMGFYPFFKIGNKNGDTGMFEPNDNSIYNDCYKTFVYYDDNLRGVSCRFFKYHLSSTDLLEVAANENGISTTRTQREGISFKTDYYDLSNVFTEADRDITYDFIELSIAMPGLAQGTTALLIPEMTVFNLDHSENESYLAFDVGTTNSFVALATERGEPEELSTLHKNPVTGVIEPQQVMLHQPVDDDQMKGTEQYDFNTYVGFTVRRAAMLNEFMPSVIAPGTTYRFPIKTAITYGVQTNVNDEKELRILNNINIPFAFGLVESRDWEPVSTNLKWNVSDTSSSVQKNELSAFVEHLVLLARNTILLRRKDPKKVKLVWFKPLAMQQIISKQFTSIWNDCYTRYFSKEAVQLNRGYALAHLKMISESAAPIYDLKELGVNVPFLNIDVGGGTCDLVYFNDEEIQLTTSIRFGGNVLFGRGGESGSFVKDNGFIRYYLPKIKEKLDDDRLKVLGQIEGVDRFRAQDVVNFLFSIKDFEDKLKRDSYFKLVLLLHNAAILYHAAQLLKSQGVKPPRTIGLSGNGAKIFQLANGGPDLAGYSRFATTIFKKVYKDDTIKDVRFLMADRPKTSTAFGGIKGFDVVDEDMERTFKVELGSGNAVRNFDELAEMPFDIINTTIGAADLLPDKGEMVLKQAIIGNVSDFLTFFFGELWKNARFVSDLGVDRSLSAEALKTYFTDPEKINTALEGVLSERKNKDKEQGITESLFFYPIAHFLFELCLKMTERENNEFSR